jgi:hypothetical protein
VPSAADLLRRLGTVAHRGRLEVARAIATEPRTAGEISALWHIDPTLATGTCGASRGRPARTGKRDLSDVPGLDQSASRSF